MPLTDITPLPTAPARTDAPDVFIARADAFIAALVTMVTQINTLAAELEVAAALIADGTAGDPGLVAMTGKTPAADRLIYFTGASTSALATITSAARALLDDADASAMLTTLGLSSFIKTLVDDADATTARATLGAAASGANTDITALDQDVAITATGTIAADTIGYRGLPQNTQTSTYALVLADAGKHISITTGGVTVPANASVAFPVGTTIAIYNNSGSAQTISITSDTLRWAGIGSTGSRTLGGYGLATLVKVASTEWVISGAGLS